VRRSLRLLVAATTSAVALSLLIPLALLVRTLAEDRALQAASEEAAATAALVATLPAEASAAAVVAVLDQRTPLRLSVMLPDGTLVSGTDAGAVGAAERSRRDADLARAAAGESFTTTTAAGAPVVYVPAVGPDGTAVVRVEVPEEETRRGVGTAVALLAGLGLVMLVVATALADVLARRISAPLVGIVATARRMREGDLRARAGETGPPEVVEVATALNDLAVRVEELLVSERESVADLAHRLRTPVTALRLASEQVSEPTGVRVRGYVSDLERAVDAVVRDARRPVRSTMSARCDAVAVARGRVAFWTPLAEDHGVSLRLEASVAQALVPVDPVELSDALDVLLDNAFAHAAGATLVEVAVATDGEHVTVTVADDGPGLAPGAAAERGASGSGSTGLGLDIARRIARAGGGDLVVGRSRTGGAAVALRLRGAPR
jgi:signal transduction histidine kinase